MNVSTINDAQEYRASMQRAALTFLQRHQGEHLTDDGHLFARAVSYLVSGLDVPTFMADRLVHLAMSELECRKRTAIGISYGTEDATRVALRSLFSGESVLIPLRHLPARLQPPAAPLAAAATH
ncbi:hypothetical protein [Stenotrophomonas sp.]|uniref:hypothetical protein n=1 Tax=Stenotrophomonas sp. TaxID=69392 RepID=UPI0028ADA2E3|nr:hypothetical protein [Stenotrophomonas sp.]